VKKISVVIATHGRPVQLQRALISVQQQTYKCHQIVVVSDAMDAETYLNCSLLLRSEDIFSQRSGAPGPAESRNLALKFVTGDYIIFLDDDDTFDLNFFENFAKFEIAHSPSSEIYYTNFQVVNEKIGLKSIDFIDMKSIDLSGYDPLNVFTKNFIPNNCLIYPRQLIADKTFDLHLPYEDWDFLLSACTTAPLRHLSIYGPRVHKNVSEGWEQRGKKNDDRLLDCYVDVYSKHPPPTPFAAAARRELFNSINIDIETMVSNVPDAARYTMLLGKAEDMLDVRASRGRLDHFDALKAGIIFTLWLGPYVMSPSRSAAVQSIFRDAGRPVCFITDSTLLAWEHPDYPFHPAFQYLSEVHRVDYLRCYLMHHYGGGYTDIKPVLQSWTGLFDAFHDPECLALGYPEISPGAVAQLPGEIGQQLRTHYSELIGYCSMIFRRRSILTTEWYRATQLKLETLLPVLQAHPAQHPMDQLGVILPNGVVSEYPLRWTELGGNIFHPLILKYRDQVVKNIRIRPQLQDYR
jgi:glycosyltransferase involved in cell wall biosynthesis